METTRDLGLQKAEPKPDCSGSNANAVQQTAEPPPSEPARDLQKTLTECLRELERYYRSPAGAQYHGEVALRPCENAAGGPTEESNHPPVTFREATKAPAANGASPQGYGENGHTEKERSKLENSLRASSPSAETSAISQKTTEAPTPQAGSRQTPPAEPPPSPPLSTKPLLPPVAGRSTGGAGPNGSGASGPNGNGGGGPNGSGGGGPNGKGGGGGGARSFQERASDREFREVLTTGLATCRKNLITVGIFSFAVNSLVLVIPVYLFNVSDRVLTSRSSDTLIMLSVVAVGLLLAHVTLDMMRRLILTRIATEAESKLGAPVLSAAAKASQNGSSREFQILSDLQQLRSFITGPVILTMLDTPVAPLYLLGVFLIHPNLGLIVTGTGVTLLILALINQKLTAVSFGRANAFGARANLQADAMARNSQVINAMGMIPEAVAIWGRETAESLKAQVVAQDRNILITAVSKFVRLTTQIGLLGVGAWLALKGEVTGGMMIAASIIGSRALAPIEGTIEGWRNFIQARAAYARIKTLLQSSALNFDRLRLPKPEGALSVERILYVPPPNKRVILNGVTFQLSPGESLAIVGASGAGKSTLGRMLVGSIVPTAGNVRLDKMDLRNWDPRQFGESVGYLPQEIQLFPASIKANIARMRADVTDEAIYIAAEIADVHEMISHFSEGYETQIAVDGSPLSGGQKQRIGLARAFFGDPRLVVLDEPNSNLDTPGEQALARALVRAKDRGITVVAITQRPTLLNSVDKIMILRDGTVQALGSRNEIIPMLTGQAPNGKPLKPNGNGGVPMNG